MRVFGLHRHLLAEKLDHRGIDLVKCAAGLAVVQNRVAAPDNPAMPSRHLARIVYLLLGAIGASFGVLMRWLLGRALRSG